MKPIMQRMIAFACRNIISQSLIEKETFHWWLTSVGSKHGAAIIEFDHGLKALLKDQPTSDAYANNLAQLINDDSSAPLEEFLNSHPAIEKFLSDHFHVIEKAAIDFIADLCVLELDKNIDYRIVDQIKVQQKENPQPPPTEIKIAPLRAEDKIAIDSHSKVSPISFIATDKFIHCLKSLQKTPFSLERLNAIGARLVALNQRRFFDRFLKILNLLANDDEMIDWICSQCQIFDFKSDTPDHFEFIERCVTLQLPLLLRCSSEVLESFCATLINFSTLSYYQEFFAELIESPESILVSQTHLMNCWKYIYRQLQMKTDLRNNQYIHCLLANLEVFLVDISDDLQDVAEPAIAENDGYGTQSDSAPSSQDVPPVAEHSDSNSDISKAISILDNTAVNELARPEQTPPHTETRTHWSQRHSLHHDKRKRGYSSLSPVPQHTTDAGQTIHRKMT